MSTAGKLAQHLKQDLRCKDVEYNITKAPLTEQKVKSLVTYLENLKLVENDCVILNLTCNFAPVVSTSTKYKTPVSEGTGRSKKYYLIDLEGRKVCIPNPGSIDILFDKISRVIDCTNGSRNLVINLSPLPRYQNLCCADHSHGLQGGDSPGSLNTMLRNVGVFMGRSDMFSQTRGGRLPLIISGSLSTSDSREELRHLSNGCCGTRSFPPLIYLQ